MEVSACNISSTALVANQNAVPEGSTVVLVMLCAQFVSMISFFGWTAHFESQMTPPEVG